jgi:hypothetical protein
MQMNDETVMRRWTQRVELAINKYNWKRSQQNVPQHQEPWLSNDHGFQVTKATEMLWN